MFWTSVLATEKTFTSKLKRIKKKPSEKFCHRNSQGKNEAQVGKTPGTNELPHIFFDSPLPFSAQYFPKFVFLWGRQSLAFPIMPLMHTHPPSPQAAEWSHGPSQLRSSAQVMEIPSQGGFSQLPSLRTWWQQRGLHKLNLRRNSFGTNRRTQCHSALPALWPSTTLRVWEDKRSSHTAFGYPAHASTYPGKLGGLSTAHFDRWLLEILPRYRNPGICIPQYHLLDILARQRQAALHFE